MRILCTVVLLAVSACSPERLRPVVTCGQPCYTGGGVIQGACHAGILECGDAGDPVCVGEVGPVDEQCNGIDDNCDGLIDENLHRECGNACGPGHSTCVGGTFVNCSAPAGKPETCNGLDDDCDGVVDNHLPIEFCYTGDSADLTRPTAPCAPGLFVCQSGVRFCAKEVLPQPETCNKIDDDCDGQIDEGVSSTDVDVVIVIDNSGSMADKLVEMKAAVIEFDSIYCQADAGTRCAIVAAPDRDIIHGSVPRLQTDFTDPLTFAAVMNAQSISGSGDEDTIGAIVMLLDTANPLRLSWDPRARRVIVVFSDEQPQSLSTSVTFNDIGRIIANVPGLPLADVYVFTDPNSYVYYAEWNTALGTGHVFNILNNRTDLGKNLGTVLKNGSCGP